MTTKLNIKMNMDNETFGELGTFETARILRDLADRIEGHPNFSPGHFQPISDINGNTVGSMDVID